MLLGRESRQFHATSQLERLIVGETGVFAQFDVLLSTQRCVILQQLRQPRVLATPGHLQGVLVSGLRLSLCVDRRARLVGLAARERSECSRHGAGGSCGAAPRRSRPLVPLCRTCPLLHQHQLSFALRLRLQRRVDSVVRLGHVCLHILFEQRRESVHIHAGGFGHDVSAGILRITAVARAQGVEGLHASPLLSLTPLLSHLLLMLGSTQHFNLLLKGHVISFHFLLLRRQSSSILDRAFIGCVTIVLADIPNVLFFQLHRFVEQLVRIEITINVFILTLVQADCVQFIFTVLGGDARLLRTTHLLVLLRINAAARVLFFFA